MMKLSDKAIFWMVLLIIGLLYFIYLPVSYDFDGTVFSHFLRYALLENNLSPVIQSHHLFYFPLNFIIYKTLNQLTGYQVLEYFHLQLFSLVFGLLTLMMSFRIMKKIIPDRFFSVLGVCLIAGSHGFWSYAVEAEVHMAGLFFVVAGIYVLFFKPPALKNTILSALLLSMASGFHLTNGLICFSVLIYFIYERRTLVSGIQFFAFYGIFFTVPYLIYSLFIHHNLVKHLLNILFGVNMFSGYRINRWEGLSINGVFNSVKALGASMLVPVSDVFVIISIGLLAGIILMAFALRLKSGNRQIMLKFIFWIIPYFLFFCFWESQNIEFKLNMVVPILILFVFSLSGLRRRKLGKGILIGVSLFLFLVNFFGNMKPRNDINANKNYLLARAIGDNTAKNSSVFIAGSGSNSYNYGKIYIPYFALRNVIILDWKLGKGSTFDLLKQELDIGLNRGEPVYFLSEITSMTGTVREVLKKHGLSPSAFDKFLDQIEFSEPIPLINNYYLRQVLALKSPSGIGIGFKPIK